MDKVKQCVSEDLTIELKASKRPRFKAGADLSGKLNRVAIEVNQEATDESETLELRLILNSEICEKSRPGNCK